MEFQQTETNGVITWTEPLVVQNCGNVAVVMVERVTGSRLAAVLFAAARTLHMMGTWISGRNLPFGF